jgi:methylenetetrahydrofolate dehydrogenase (NADP+)/methenyltetrahydrofolate cyclohydrolase
MGIIFDGKAFAKDMEASLQGKLVGKKIVSIVDPDNAAGMMYSNLKQKMADRLQVKFQIINAKYQINELVNKIKILNEDPGVNGIMLQLPYAGSDEVIKLIKPTKDIDGLREDSPYVPAVVIAVEKILKSKFKDPNKFKKVIIGAKGFVGGKLMKVLPKAIGMDKDDFDVKRLKTADVIISCTGQTGLITPDMVKVGVACIDVGFPKGDFAPEVAHKASFFTPVPGGVGPVTIASLFTNIL